MALEADLYALLAPLVAGRVYPDVGPNNAVAPYATYQQIGGEVINYLGREAPDKRHARMQLNVWCASRAQAMALMRQVEDALRMATAFIAAPIGAAIAVKDEGDPLYGAMQDYSIWHT